MEMATWEKSWFILPQVLVPHEFHENIILQGWVFSFWTILLMFNLLLQRIAHEILMFVGMCNCWELTQIIVTILILNVT